MARGVVGFPGRWPVRPHGTKWANGLRFAASSHPRFTVMEDALIWSVGLVVDDAESRALSESSVAFYMLEVGEGHHLDFSAPPSADARDVENLRFDVRAASGRDARERALGIVYRARRAVGLPDRVIPVAWVAPRISVDDGESYLDQAEDLFEAERYSLAIAAAEIHIESQTRKMIELAVARFAPSFSQVLLQHRNNTKLRHIAGRKMIERFLGLRVVDLSQWTDYKAHVVRRDQVVHAGMSFEEAEASDSLRTVREIWLEIAAAALRAEGVEPQALASDEIAGLIAA